MEYPQQIEATFLEIALIDEELKQRRNAVRTIELEVTFDVTSAKDENGKLILTNEKQREGAIAKMLAEHEGYNQLAKQLSNLEHDRVVCQARLERLRMELKLHILEAEQRNYLAALKVADSIYHARQNGSMVIVEPEIELPF